MAGEDVASAVCRVVVGAPLNGILEVAGPEQFGLDDLIRTGLAFRGDPREVVTEEVVRSVFGLDNRVIDDPVSHTPLVVPVGRHQPRRPSPASPASPASHSSQETR